jgi:hypothetical protein
MRDHLTIPLLTFLLGLVLFGVGAWSYQAAQGESGGVIWTGGMIAGGLLMLRSVIPLLRGLITERSRGRCAMEDCAKGATYDAELRGGSDTPLCGRHCAEALMGIKNGWARERRTGRTLKSSDSSRLAELLRSSGEATA